MCLMNLGIVQARPSATLQENHRDQGWGPRQIKNCATCKQAKSEFFPFQFPVEKNELTFHHPPKIAGDKKRDEYSCRCKRFKHS